MAHVRQFHWFDLLIVEIISVLLWFNPFVLLYKKSLKLQHEYLADANAIKDRDQIENYLYCMLKHIQMASFGGITSQFYCKTIKKRIVMITKNKTSNKYLGVYIFVLPLVCCMLSAFSAAKVTLPPNSEIVMFTLNQPSIYPVDSKKIKRVPGYGERINPKTKKKGFHYGIDFAISEGEEVISTAEGVVVDAKFDSTKGNYVIIKHDEIFSTFYSHLRSISVEVGDKLERGQVIGYSGNTGLSTGPHLHYEVLKSEKRVDPTDYLPK
ncbi:MAG: peptidoglycan DD-metalloendopeptidase family protein [Bacteroides sp.]|nr:peptidoglycan DD-metalloendopeptidase family protein [Bacteroides sp.]